MGEGLEVEWAWVWVLTVGRALPLWSRAALINRAGGVWGADEDRDASLTPYRPDLTLCLVSLQLHGRMLRCEICDSSQS